MKHYPKIHKDWIDRWERHEKHISSANGSVDDLILLFRSFYVKTHLEIFDYIVREVWLEQQVVVGGRRRVKRKGNCLFDDMSFGKFTNFAVGISGRVLTSSSIFTPVATYLIDFFPDFLKNNPFENPEKYLYPYKHVTLDFLFFVYQADNRLELLDYAEKKGINIAEFINWATNHVLSYNLENDVEKYEIKMTHRRWDHIINNDLKSGWEDKKFLFDTK